jgi:serine/threonine protein phosphatase 1
LPRNLAIGDIHGCLNALTKLIEFVDVQDDDQLITLGDYVDRGPDSKSVLDWLIEQHAAGRVRPLRGNHDIMMLDARHDPERLPRFLQVGGDSTLNSYAPENTRGTLDDVPTIHWEFLENCLLPYFETESHFFVHANAYPEIPLADQPDFMLYWEKYNDPPRHDSGKIMVCGHSAQKSGIPKFNDNAICIDTKCYGQGWLTCLEPETRRVWQANQAGDVRKFFLDEADCWKN